MVGQAGSSLPQGNKAGKACYKAGKARQVQGRQGVSARQGQAHVTSIYSMVYKGKKKGKVARQSMKETRYKGLYRYTRHGRQAWQAGIAAGKVRGRRQGRGTGMARKVRGDGIAR